MDFIVPSRQPVFMDKIGLIDADYIKYHVLSRLKKDADMGEVKRTIESSINELQSNFVSQKFIFCFSGGYESNFRTKIALSKAYKGTRNVSDDIDNEVKRYVVQHIRLRYPSLMFPELEADDICSMLQDEDTFIYSEDKDLLQVPGTHWNIKRKEFIYISEDEALRNLMRQMLIGDVVDNIEGLKGYGPVACDKLLTNADEDEIIETILDKYIEQMGIINGIDAFVENWMLLKLRLNRGAYFKKKYEHAFKTLDLLR